MTESLDQLFDPEPSSLSNGNGSKTLAPEKPCLDAESPSPSDPQSSEQLSFVLGVQDGQQPRGYLLNAGMYSIGRNSSNEIVIPNRFVSRRHAYLIHVPSPGKPEEFTYCLVDGNRKGSSSTNGVKVNGNKIATHYLESGDLIEFGPEVQAYFFSVTLTQSMESKAKAFGA